MEIISFLAVALALPGAIAHSYELFQLVKKNKIIKGFVRWK
jgi:hypothetical protein